MRVSWSLHHAVTFGKAFVHRLVRDDIGAYAAALSYSLLFAIFPLGLVLAAVLPALPLHLPTAESIPTGIVSPEVRDLFVRVIRASVARPTLAYLGALGYLYGMSSAFRRLIDAFNHAYEYVPKLRRPAYKTLILSVVLALTLGLLLIAAIVLATGGAHLCYLLLSAIAGRPVATSVSSVVRWLLVIGLAVILLAVLYWIAPDRPHRFRWISLGAVVAVVLWLFISAAFSIYLTHFNSYNLLYGSVGAFILLLLYVYIFSYAVLLGAELDAMLETDPR